MGLKSHCSSLTAQLSVTPDSRINQISQTPRAVSPPLLLHPSTARYQLPAGHSSVFVVRAATSSPTDSFTPDDASSRLSPHER